MKKIGTLILAIGLVLGFSSCKIETEEVTLEKIEITAQPSKTEYFVGEELNTTGLEVTVIYSDKSTKVVTDWTTTGYDKEKAGEQTVEVSYSENEITKTANFTVTVKEKKAEPGNEPPKVELTKIEITAQPSKTAYFVGEELDTTGLEVTATYSDESTKVVTGWTTTGYDETKAGEQTVEVSYTENKITKTTSFTVTVKEKTTEPGKEPGNEPPKVELTKIEVTTQPTRKKYYVGSSALNLTGMVVTATYNNGATADVTKDITTSGFDSSKAVESQTITVTYDGKSATFTVEINQGYTFHNAVTTLESGTTGSYGTDATYVEFGDWPQDVVATDEVATLGLETSKDKITRGYMEFVQGSDGNYYVKHEIKWFKVMPIKWRVADTDYKDASGTATGKLLVAESILTGNVPYYESTSDRTIDGFTIYANNYRYSQIRAYLNGISYQGQSEEQTKWNNKGFLQTAFTSDAINKIITTKVDNSTNSMTDKDYNQPIDKEFAWIPTEDKIFLISEFEVTKYSKEKYNEYGKGNSRLRVTTNFAEANGALQCTYGGYWWLRSPSYDSIYSARYVDDFGYAGLDRIFNVSDTAVGVVPALSISF